MTCREYVELECGCLVSCDGGGGLIPCSFGDFKNTDCKVGEYLEVHKEICPDCGECMVCYNHEFCKKEIRNG